MNWKSATGTGRQDFDKRRKNMGKYMGSWQEDLAMVLVIAVFIGIVMMIQLWVVPNASKIKTATKTERAKARRSFRTSVAVTAVVIIAALIAFFVLRGQDKLFTEEFFPYVPKP